MEVPLSTSVSRRRMYCRMCEVQWRHQLSPSRVSRADAPTVDQRSRYCQSCKRTSWMIGFACLALADDVENLGSMEFVHRFRDCWRAINSIPL